MATVTPQEQFCTLQGASDAKKRQGTGGTEWLARNSTSQRLNCRHMSREEIFNEQSDSLQKRRIHYCACNSPPLHPTTSQLNPHPRTPLHIHPILLPNASLTINTAHYFFPPRVSGWNIACISCVALHAARPAHLIQNDLIALTIYRGFDKSLARPGKKQATVTRLGC